MRIAIHQPYFCPYAGYFRLMAATDLFVIYDDVQYSKGSWVARNMVQRTDGKKDWLTIPLSKRSVETKICDLKWAERADEKWDNLKLRFKIFREEPDYFLRFYTYYLQNAGGRMLSKGRTPVDFIIGALEAANYDLQIGVRGKIPLKANTIRSSELDIPSELKGQDRVIYICEMLGATEYVNSPGGRELYNEEEFKRRNIKLKFFSDFPNKTSIIDRLHLENAREIKKEIDHYSELS